LPSTEWPNQAWVIKSSALTGTRAAVPRQESDHDANREQRETKDRHRAKWRFKKEKTQIFGINDAAKVLCHIDQNQREPGDAGNRGYWRGDAEQNGCRAKRSWQSAKARG